MPSPEPLLSTKFHIPPPRADLVPRPRLLQRLHEALQQDCRLILVSAPAGYGKTTLIADWGLRIADSSGPKSAICNPQSCWLTLDEDDNDPALFLTDLIAALQPWRPAGETMAQTLLVASPDPRAQARRVLGALVNDILATRPNPFVLVLDDLYRVTEPGVYAALDYLIERAPPPMRLIIATRYDPPLALARLRARGQLAELRLHDLAFTLAETTAFLNDALRLDLSAADLEALQARTEGWPAGLRLLALSLAAIPTPAGRSDLVRDLARTDRYVFDFLAEEVLDRQPPPVRTFLLETSILAELTPARCQAVTGRPDAAALLEDLDRRNIFLVNLQAPGSTLQTPTYRYYALFAEFLRQRLRQEMPERVRELHRRAAETQADSFRAIRHYLAAEMWEEAAQTIEQVGWNLLQQGLLDTIVGWIDALPTPIRDAHPLLTRLLGACAFWRGDFQAAQPLLERTVDGFQALGDEAGVGESLADLASSAFLQSDFARAGALIERALAYPLSPRSRAQALMSRTWLGLFGGERARAAADLQAAVSLAETGQPEVLLMLAFNLKSYLAALPGGLECMERFCQLAATHLGAPVSPLRAAVEELTAFAHFWRGRLPEAIQAGESALSLNERLGGYPFVGLDATLTLAVAHIAQGHYAAADHFLDAALRQARQMPLSQGGTTGVLGIAGHTRWLQGDLEEARRIYAQMCAAAHAPELPDAPASRLRMQGVLELAERRYAVAERTLRQAVTLEQRTPTAVILYGSARLLLAHLYRAWNRPTEALAELAPVLAECERAATPGFILQAGAAIVPALRLAVERGVHPIFAAHLLDVLGAGDEPRPVFVPATGETLTPREVAILRLIAQGLSNRAIAERLTLTEGTVKSHVHSIFGKLGVTSRTEAAAHARSHFGL